MKNFFMKPFRWAAVFSLLLVGSFAFTLLDTFVLPQELTAVDHSVSTATAASDAAGTGSNAGTTAAGISDDSYEDDNVKITIDTIRVDNSTVYLADIRLSDPSYLKTALAEDTFGRNIKAKTSKTAAAHSAILAINGDYYGFRNAGYVLRNDTLFRDTARESGDAEDLVIDKEGNFSILSEQDTAVSSLDTSKISQIFSFGPALIANGEIVVDSRSEVSQSKNSNPRTAIGQISELHYLMVVSDGRTSESTGLSLLQLAELMKEKGCTTAYNLDGGGSSTMYFNGEIVNVPTDGRKMGEREVSDIVYIGY